MKTAPSSLLRSAAVAVAAYQQARALYAHKLAPDFNSFHFIRPNELKLSAILAWMLDPKASHSQGELFLHCFSDSLALGWSAAELRTAQVSTETRLPNGKRIDVLVRSGSKAFGIENKPWAADQPNQVSAYLNYLNIFSAKRLLFLAGQKGLGPSSYSIAEQDRSQAERSGELIIKDYNELKIILERCSTLCRSERVRGFLEDFQNYIVETFSGSHDMTEQAALSSLVQAAENIDAAMKIASAWELAKMQLLALLKQQITTSSAGGVPQLQQLSSARHSQLSIQIAEHIYFAVHFDASGYRDFCYGVFVSQDWRAEAAEIQRCIESSAFGKGAAAVPEYEWAWWNYTSEDDAFISVERNWVSSRPWEAIKSGSLAAQINATAAQMGDVIKVYGK